MTYIVIAMLAAIAGAIGGFLLGVSGERIRSAELLDNVTATEQRLRRQLTIGTPRTLP